MSTPTSQRRQCEDCAKHGIATDAAGKSPRCYAHSNLRRRWSVAKSKAKSRGVVNYPEYDESVLFAKRVEITKKQVIELDNLQRTISAATSDLVGSDTKVDHQVLWDLGRSQRRLREIVDVLKAAGKIGNPADMRR